MKMYLAQPVIYWKFLSIAWNVFVLHNLSFISKCKGWNCTRNCILKYLAEFVLSACDDAILNSIYHRWMTSCCRIQCSLIWFRSYPGNSDQSEQKHCVWGCGLQEWMHLSKVCALSTWKLLGVESVLEYTCLCCTYKSSFLPKWQKYTEFVNEKWLKAGQILSKISDDS